MARKQAPDPDYKPTIYEKFADAGVKTYDHETTSEWQIANELSSFGEHPDARCIPQFLALKGVGWGTFKYWMKSSWRIKNAYEHTLSMLWCRWFDFIADNKKLPAHHIKMAEKFLNVYDDNLINILNDKAKAQSQAQAATIVTTAYKTENYQTLEMEEPYKSKYEEQEKKREDQ